MERTVDLDAAAAEIERRRVRWTGAGLKVGPVTWRDQAAPWPQALETDRGRVRDPDSAGVNVVGPEDAEAEIILFRGGWCDVDFFSEATGWEAVSEAPEARTAAEFGTVLDSVVARAFGTGSAGSAAAPA